MKERIVIIASIFLVVTIGFSLAPYAFAPYHQQPQKSMSVSTDKSSYNFGDTLTINGQGAESYSISIQIMSPSGEEITEISTFKSGAGEFSTIWIIPSGLEQGTYTIKASDASQTAQTTFEIASNSVPDVEKMNAESKVQIPDWIKRIGEFWVTDQIDDDGFVQVIQWLIQQEIIVVPYAEEPEDASSSQIPIWIKTTTEFWVNQQISDDEFSTALEWLINNGVIRVSTDDTASEGNTIKVEISDGIGTGDK